MFSINHSSTIFLPMVILRQQEPVKNLISLNCEKLPWNIRTWSAWQRGNVAERLEDWTCNSEARSSSALWLDLFSVVACSDPFYCSTTSIACVASVSVWLRSNERPVLAAKEMKREPKTLLLEPFFTQSALTLVPRSLLLNRKETLATQATTSIPNFFSCLIYCIEVLTHSMYNKHLTTNI